MDVCKAGFDCISPTQFSTVFKTSGHISESTGREIFWRHKAPSERRRCELPSGGLGGMLPQEIFKKEHTETPKYQFLRQGWSSLKLYIKLKSLMKLDSWTGGQGDKGTGRGDSQ